MIGSDPILAFSFVDNLTHGSEQNDDGPTESDYSHLEVFLDDDAGFPPLEPEVLYMATGRVVIDVERCKGCELCREACPKDVLALAEDLNAKGYRPVILLDPHHDCTGCALCATVCPDGCITVYRDIPIEKVRQPQGLTREVVHHG